MVSAADTHEVFNQSPPFAGFNLFSSDPTLGALVEGLPQPVVDQLTEHGAQWGTPETFELGRIANDQPPVLRNFDGNGVRIDALEFHPAYHALMRRSVASGLQCSIWDASGDEANARAVTRAARLYMTAEVDAGHLNAMTMTNASVAALAHASDLADTWLPRIRTRRYDSSPRPLSAKANALIGLGFAEKQGGSDLGANTTAAVESGGRFWTITGHKWFMSAPMSDAFLVLAQAEDGLSCFLVPRMLPDGNRNAIRLVRLKDKLGNRSNATAEAEFDGAAGWLVGEAGGGIPTIIDMVTLTRLDCAVASAGLMRVALAEATHHLRYRKAFGAALIDQPLMTRVVADMALDAVAAALGRVRSISAWRMQVTTRPDGVTVINDAYNANPESMRAALAALAAMGRPDRRTHAVLGPMAELGPASEEEHRELGKTVAALGIGRLVVVGPVATAIADGAIAAGFDVSSVTAVDDVGAAVKSLDADLRPDDVVLVKASRSADLQRVAEALLLDMPRLGAPGGASR